MPELLEFDPTSENAANSPLSVMTSSYRVTSHSYPAPQLNVLYASSVDTEGELPASRRYSNRTISMTIEMVDATGSLTRALQAKVAKIAREGGTLKRTLTTGQVIVFDLCDAQQFDPTFDVSYYSANLVIVQLVLGARPFGRGAPVTLSAHSETTLPCLVFTETGITGDVPALGKLVVTESQSVDQWFVMWGLESLNYSSSANAALFYEAEGRTAMGGSSTVAGPSGASGSGSNVMRNTALATLYQSILSTQATGGGAHLSHVGDFRVWARVQIPTSNNGNTTIALEWSQGDFRSWARNTEYVIPSTLEGTWSLVDLGQVHLTAVAQGTQRWEGRIIAKSDATGKGGPGDDKIDIDCLFVVPVSEGYGEAEAVPPTASPTVFTARDEFEQAAGALNGKTLPVGGTWATSGSATDFAVESTGHTLQRTTTTDTGYRFAIAGTSTLTNAVVQSDIAWSAWSPTALPGMPISTLVARYTDANNYLQASILQDSFTGTATNQLGDIAIEKFVAGTGVYLGRAVAPFVAGVSYTMRLYVDTAGRVMLWWAIAGQALGDPIIISQHADLATGGTLATGKTGVSDTNNSTLSQTRTYDNFIAFAPVLDAAMFSGRQIEIRNDRVIRSDSGGTVWQAPSSYEGDYLQIPPAGAEARTLRMFVKASRHPPGVLPDSGIDDISATLTYTPRYLVIP